MSIYNACYQTFKTLISKIYKKKRIHYMVIVLVDLLKLISHHCIVYTFTIFTNV